MKHIITLLLLLPITLMAQTRSIINIGANPNDGTGDTLRTAFGKTETNFITLFQSVYTNGVQRLASPILGNLTTTNSPYVWLNGTNIWMEARGSLKLYSPALYAGSANNGEVLTLIDDSDGAVEFAPLNDTTKLPLSGGTLSGNLSMGSTNRIINLGAPTGANDATTKAYVDAADNARLQLAGGTMSGPIAMGTQKITGLGIGTASTDAINLGQIDERITVDQARDNIILNPASNFIVDTNSATREVTLLAASGAQPSRIGTSSHTIAGFVASGAIVARRTYWVDGSSGQLTYNAVAYNPGQTFVGVYGVKTYTATGNCRAKDNITRQTDTYTPGTAYVASILGGYDHLNNQAAGTIAGGGHNVLLAGGGGNHSTIAGGSYNTQQSGVYAFIGGGTQNENRVDFGFIGGGWGNWITDDNWSAADQGTIVNGQEGQIQDTAYGFIGTGLNNRVINPFSSTSVFNNQIINGQGNIVQSLAAGVNYGTVLNGTGIIISGGSHNTSWGQNNVIYGNSGGYGVAIGNAVVIDGTGTYGFGYGSTITQTNSPRAVVMGASDTITNSSDTWTFANNSTVTGANYGFTAGNANTLNGTQYTFLLGRSLSSADLTSPSANADYGLATGYQAVIRSYGQRVESNGNESTVNVQRSRYILKRRADHTTGVDLQLRLDGSVEFPYVPTNSVWTCRAMITAAQSDGVKFGAWTLDFAVRDSAGTLSLLGSPSSVVVHDGHSTTWTISAGIRSDGTYRGIVLNARALTGETVTWGAALDTMELNSAW